MAAFEYGFHGSFLDVVEAFFDVFRDNVVLVPYLLELPFSRSLSSRAYCYSSSAQNPSSSQCRQRASKLSQLFASSSGHSDSTASLCTFRLSSLISITRYSAFSSSSDWVKAPLFLSV